MRAPGGGLEDTTRIERAAIIGLYTHLLGRWPGFRTRPIGIFGLVAELSQTCQRGERTTYFAQQCSLFLVTYRNRGGRTAFQ